MNVKIDLTEKSGSIGHVMKENRDAILSVKSSAEACEMLKGLFEKNGINTPKSRLILSNLGRGMSYARTLIYLNDIIMKSQRLGVI